MSAAERQILEQLGYSFGELPSLSRRDLATIAAMHAMLVSGMFNHRTAVTHAIEAGKLMEERLS